MPVRGEHRSAAARTCEVYALVEATPISQPALMCTPQCVERAMAEPTVLVTPMQSAPRAFAYSSAYMQMLLQGLGENTHSAAFIAQQTGECKAQHRQSGRSHCHPLLRRTVMAVHRRQQGGGLTLRVSAVSPDWLTKTHMSSLKMGAWRSSRSEASSSDTCAGKGTSHALLRPAYLSCPSMHTGALVHNAHDCRKLVW